MQGTRLRSDSESGQLTPSRSQLTQVVKNCDLICILIIYDFEGCKLKRIRVAQERVSQEMNNTGDRIQETIIE